MISNRWLPTQRSWVRSFLLTVLIIILYIIDNSSIRTLVKGGLYNNFIKPILWIGLALVAWSFPLIHPRAKLKYRSFLKLWAFNFAIIFIIISALAGLIDGFGKSPYSQTPKGIIMNIIFVGSVLIAGEFVRATIISNWTLDENYFVFLLTSLLMTISKIPLGRFIGLGGLADIVKFSAEYFAPELSHNLLATYLAFIGGPSVSLIYLGTIQIFHWLSPILPNLKWITRAFIGVLCPIFSLMVIQAMYLKETGAIKKHDKDDGELVGWMVTSLLSIAIIWFAVGVFPIYPSVIATGSMEPMIYPGDLILVKKIGTIEELDNLQPDDVIQFKKDGILISHRIIKTIYDENNQKTYRTKGDNNNAVDREAVLQQEVRGRIIRVIPKVGWPTLLMKSKE